MSRFELIIFLFPLLIFGCLKQSEKNSLIVTEEIFLALDIPEVEIEKSALNYNNKKSLWTIDGKLFSGYAISYFEDGTMQEKVGILEGKKQNESIAWYPDGYLKQVAKYHIGKLHGEKKYWSSDSTHVLISQLNYSLGKAHGKQKKWYPTGEVFKVLNLNMGKEEGIQQAFRKNGDLFANYEAREGRIFGLKKAALCFGLESEIVQYED